MPAIASAAVTARRRVRFPLTQPDWLEARFVIGARATLPKPVSANLLIETVKKLLGETA